MSRLFAIFVSTLHMIGGLLTGYHAYELRTLIEGSESGFETSMLMTDTWAMIGPFIIIVAFALHLWQATRAHSARVRHLSFEGDLQEQLQTVKSANEVLRTALDENERVMGFCRNAITEASTKKLAAEAPEPAALQPSTLLLGDGPPIKRQTKAMMTPKEMLKEDEAPKDYVVRGEGGNREDP